MNDTIIGYLKLAYTLVVILIIVSSAYLFINNRNDNKEKVRFCADHFNNSLVSDDHARLLYWQDNGLCCKYKYFEETKRIGVYCA